MSEKTLSISETNNNIIFEEFIYNQLEAKKDETFKISNDSQKEYSYKNLCIDETTKEATEMLFKNPEELSKDFKEICDKYFKTYILNNLLQRGDMHPNYKSGYGLMARKLYNFYYLYTQYKEFKENKDSIGEKVNMEDFYKESDVKNTQIFKNGKVKAVTSDLHGSINATLFFLLDSGVAKFKENEPNLIFFDMVSKKSYKNVEDFLEQNPEAKIEDFKFLKLIPNLEINENYDGKIVNCGDLIDAGFYSDEIVATFNYLEEQEKDKNIDDRKIIIICGNHEIVGFNNKTDKDTLNWNNREFIYRDILEDKVKLLYADNGVLYSHTLPLADNLKDCIDFVKNFKNKYENEFKELYNDFNEEEFLMLKKEIEDAVIYNNKVLSKDCVNLLPKYINPLLKLEAIQSLKNPDNEYIIDENNNKELIEKTIKNFPHCSMLNKNFILKNIIENLVQNRKLDNPICNCVFGHTPIRIDKKPSVYRNKNILAFDIDYDQSEEKIMNDLSKYYNGCSYDGKTYAFYLKLKDNGIQANLCKIDISLETQCNKENSLLRNIEDLELDFVYGNGKSPNYSYFINDKSIVINKEKALEEQQNRKKLIEELKIKKITDINKELDSEHELINNENLNNEEKINNCHCNIM